MTASSPTDAPPAEAPPSHPTAAGDAAPDRPLGGGGLGRDRTTSMLLVALPLVVVAVAVVALGVGRLSISPGRVVRILVDNLVGLDQDWTDTEANVVERLRAPRVVLALLVGGGLACSGAVLQGVLRNPLVSPQILGVSSGASFGGALAIAGGLGSAFLVAGAFLFGLAALLLVFLMSRVDGRTPLLMLVLSGVVVSAFFSALVSGLTYVSDPQQRLPAIVFWLLGSLATASWDKVVTAIGPIGLGVAVMMAFRWRVNVLSLGDEDARALGVPVQLLRWTLLVSTAVVVAGAVAVSGVIGWVGLVIAHLGRMLVGPDHRVLLPVSFVLGAGYLTAMDTLARTAIASEIPIGILTAVIGAPAFFVLLRQTKGRGWVDA